MSSVAHHILLLPFPSLRLERAGLRGNSRPHWPGGEDGLQRISLPPQTGGGSLAGFAEEGPRTWKRNDGTLAHRRRCDLACLGPEVEICLGEAEGWRPSLPFSGQTERGGLSRIHKERPGVQPTRKTSQGLCLEHPYIVLLNPPHPMRYSWEPWRGYIP